jgi:four helix bundle protein
MGLSLIRRSGQRCFGEAVVRFAKKIPVNPVTMPLISQLVRAATSVGGNYCDADEAGSRKAFRYRIGLCKRESRESKHQIRMLVAAEPQLPRRRATALAGRQGVNADLRRHPAELPKGRLTPSPFVIRASSLIGHWGFVIGHFTAHGS